MYDIYHHKDGGEHLDARQAGIGHFQIQACAEEYIQGNVNDGKYYQQSSNGLPFRESGQIGDIPKRRAKDLGGSCQEKSADTQRLFWIILGEDEKMEKADKSFLFHVADYMKNDFVSQDDFDRVF